MSAAWLCHEATGTWRRVPAARNGPELRARVEGRVLVLRPAATTDGVRVWSAEGWSWHPRQVPPCRVCGDLLSVRPGRADLVTDDRCGRCRPDVSCDPAASFTQRRIELRARAA